MVEKIKELIKNKYEQLNIISIYKIGSQCFCENCKDKDYKVIVDNAQKDRMIIYDKENDLDILIYSKEYFEKTINFEITTRETLFIINDIFKPTQTIYGDNSLNFKLLENADKYKNYLRERLLPFFSKNASWQNHKNVCAKKFWCAIWGLMIIENNSYEITDEMLEIANKCHNYELPKAWEDWVKEKIY